MIDVRKGVLPAVVCVAVALAGCGSSEEEKVAQALHTAVEGLVEQDGNKACAVVSSQARREAERLGRGQGCVQAIPQLGRVPSFKRLLSNFRDSKVTDVRIDGDRATARVVSDSGESAKPTKLHKEDGEWRLTEIAPALVD